jgi:hypothetical protein
VADSRKNLRSDLRLQLQSPNLRRQTPRGNHVPLKRHSRPVVSNDHDMDGNRIKLVYALDSSNAHGIGNSEIAIVGLLSHGGRERDRGRCERDQRCYKVSHVLSFMSESDIAVSAMGSFRASAQTSME